ncbi:MAG TPA: F0F1 ATP synthase subunit B [Steroidobacteraceae bacterium]|nr:F0F1 ATP synthase subunit B [Steroidobacteraceae bacterium]
MEINATFIGQIIVFLILLWFISKVVVPMLAGPIGERQRRIAEGLAAAEQGQKDLAEAQSRVDALVREARERARAVEDQAARRANETLEAAKQNATQEGARIVAAAQAEAGNEVQRAREELAGKVGTLVVASASKLLGREIDPQAHAQLLEQLNADIARG